MRIPVLGRARADLGLDHPIADGHGPEEDNGRDLLASVSVRSQQTPDGGRALPIVGLEGLDPQRYSSFEVCRQPALQLESVVCFPIPCGGVGDDPRNHRGGARADQSRRGSPWS